MGINLGDMIVIYWNHSSQHICYPLVIKHGLVQDFGFSFFCFFFFRENNAFQPKVSSTILVECVCVFLASEKWGIHQQNVGDVELKLHFIGIIWGFDLQLKYIISPYIPMNVTVTHQIG